MQNGEFKMLEWQAAVLILCILHSEFRTQKRPRMQSSSRALPFKQTLAGASPATDASLRSPSFGSASHFVHVAQLDQSATVRRWTPQVQLLPWTPILPLCLSSYRASFVNLYSSVQVRPEAPAFADRLRLGGPFNGDHDVTAASRPVKAFVPVRIR